MSVLKAFKLLLPNLWTVAQAPRIGRGLPSANLEGRADLRLVRCCGIITKRQQFPLLFGAAWGTTLLLSACLPHCLLWPRFRSPQRLPVSSSPLPEGVPATLFDFTPLLTWGTALWLQDLTSGFAS
jgi:hypothetical protein